MSHAWVVACKRCLESSEDLNHGKDELVEAVRSVPALVALAATGLWEPPELTMRRVPGLAQFLVLHAPCNAFWVESEYNYPAVQVLVPGPADAVQRMERS